VEATVANVNDEKIRLTKVTQLGKEYRQHYEICDFNMVELQINRNFATPEQLLFLAPNNSPNNEPNQPPNQIVKQS
jgi:hypothetical protein